MCCLSTFISTVNRSPKFKFTFQIFILSVELQIILQIPGPTSHLQKLSIDIKKTLSPFFCHECRILIKHKFTESDSLIRERY